MDANYIAYIICSILSFVPALVLHEVSHGYAAYRLGDPTAKQAGRLTLNPLKHIDPFGTVILPLVLMILQWPIFGYAKPVPYNPTYFKNPRVGDFLVGIAGPAANLVMAAIAALIAQLLVGTVSFFGQSAVYDYFYLMFLPMFTRINLYLLFFNLLPIPPLDGSSILALVIPRRYLKTYYSIQRYSFPIFLIVIVVLPYVIGFNPFSWYLNATAGNLANLMLPFQIA